MKFSNKLHFLWLWQVMHFVKFLFWNSLSLKLHLYFFVYVLSRFGSSLLIIIYSRVISNSLSVVLKFCIVISWLYFSSIIHLFSSFIALCMQQFSGRFFMARMYLLNFSFESFKIFSVGIWISLNLFLCGIWFSFIFIIRLNVVL